MGVGRARPHGGCGEPERPPPRQNGPRTRFLSPRVLSLSPPRPPPWRAGVTLVPPPTPTQPSARPLPKHPGAASVELGARWGGGGRAQQGGAARGADFSLPTPLSLRRGKKKLTWQRSPSPRACPCRPADWRKGGREGAIVRVGTGQGGRLVGAGGQPERGGLRRRRPRLLRRTAVFGFFSTPTVPPHTAPTAASPPPTDGYMRGSLDSGAGGATRPVDARALGAARAGCCRARRSPPPPPSPLPHLTSPISRRAGALSLCFAHAPQPRVSRQRAPTWIGGGGGRGRGRGRPRAVSGEGLWEGARAAGARTRV